jgi:hypothetical protein
MAYSSRLHPFLLFVRLTAVTTIRSAMKYVIGKNP